MWTVKRVAMMSGVSVRTLHHYDAIGLLPPSHIGENGYRYYEQADLLRLQQVLFYRELRMALSDIKAVLDAPEFDLGTALRQHRRQLVANVARYRQLISTIDDTLTKLKGHMEMTNPISFEGFSPEKQAAHEKELVARFGAAVEPHIAQSRKKLGDMADADKVAAETEGHQINLDLMGLIADGAQPGDAAVQAVVGRHYKWICRFWTPDAKAYAGLAQLYRDHEDFRAFYDTYDPRLCDFLGAAMVGYAETRLSDTSA